MLSRPGLVRFLVLQLALVAAVIGGLWVAYPAWRLGQVSDRLRKQFPDVPQVSTADLAGWIAEPTKVKPVILDARSPEEFAVSRLVAAHRVDPLAELHPEDLPDDREQIVVAYCSTGDRSTAFARRLLRAGYHRVYALEGGIVRWANEGRPMSDGRQLVTRVQTDEESARLLKRSHRTAAPATP